MTSSSTPTVTATVLPDVTGLDKPFDYLIPPDLEARVQVGSLVRVPLHGRRVVGWVLRIGPADPAIAPERLRPIAAVAGHGPSAEVIELARWATHRWAGGRLRPLLAAATPHRRIREVVPTQPTSRVVRRDPPTGLGRLLADGGGVLRVAPTTDLASLFDDVVVDGQLLVIHPSVDAARSLAEQCRRSGRSVALLPHDWERAASGAAEMVIGGRSAVWATVARLGGVVVLDEHDEALQEERVPTWHGRDVALERSRRCGVPCALVSPCPTVTALQWSGRRWMRPAVEDEVAGWPTVDVIDRRDEAPWTRSLLSSDLLQLVRQRDLRVVCVHNVVGRSRLSACRSCNALIRCEGCDAALSQSAAGVLVCRRCGLSRPPVCQACGSGAIAVVRPGVSRLRDELEAAAARRVVAVTAETADPWADGGAEVLIGTEAVLHRVSDADVVAFCDFDGELLAPRYRAGEQALALLVRAARLVGPRARGGRLLVQTTMPDHDVLVAATSADPGILARADAARRRALGLPPFGALARVTGPGASAFAGALGASAAPDGDGVLVRAPGWDELADLLARTERPAERIRIEVDPPRR